MPDNKLTRTEVDKALLDPAAVFERPDQVLAVSNLTQAQKVEILQRWEYDARELQVAEEEGMGGRDPDLLDAIISALHQLSVKPAGPGASPTKHGGV